MILRYQVYWYTAVCNFCGHKATAAVSHKLSYTSYIYIYVLPIPRHMRRRNCNAILDSLSPQARRNKKSKVGKYEKRVGKGSFEEKRECSLCFFSLRFCLKEHRKEQTGETKGKYRYTRRILHTYVYYRIQNTRVRVHTMPVPATACSKKCIPVRTFWQQTR